MKPKQTIDPNVAGEEFKKLLAEDRIALKDIRAAKATRKQQLKAALTVVWEALGKGITVNGYNTREDWAKDFAGYSRRQCEYIVYGRPPRKNANHGSLLKELLDVINCTLDIRVVRKAAMVMGEIGGYEPKTSVEVDDLGIYESDEKTTISVKQFTKFEDQKFEERPKPAPVTHIKYSARKAQCHTRYINRPRKGTVFAKNAEEATCPDCIAMRDKVPVKGTLQEARERAMAKQTVTVTINDCPPKNVAPEVVAALERRKKNMALGYEDGLIPADGIGEEPTEDEEQL